MASDRENSALLLVDDHPLMRKGLRALLEGEPDLEVAGEAGDGEQALVGRQPFAAARRSGSVHVGMGMPTDLCAAGI